MVIAIVCALLSLIAYQYSASIEHEKVEAEVAYAGIDQRVKLQSSFAQTIEILDTVGRFISQSDNLDRASFANFTRPIIHNHPELWAVHWVPRISGQGRALFEQQLAKEGYLGGITAINEIDNTLLPAPVEDIYYPILYAEPSEKSHVAVGFNSYSRDLNAAVINQLTDGHAQYLGSGPYNLFLDLSDELALSYYQPVFDEHCLDRDRVKGFVLALIQPQALLDALDSRDSSVFLKLYDVTGGGLVEVATTAEATTAMPAVSYRSEFSVMGRNWLLEVWNESLQPENTIDAAEWLLLLGLLLILLLALILYWLTKTHRQILFERDLAQSYLDTVETIMLMLDHNGVIQMINRKGCEVLGIKATDLLGKNWFTSRTLGHPEEERQSFNAMLLHGSSMTDQCKSEGTIRMADGQSRLILWRDRLRFDNKGNIVGVLCAGVDITEQRQSELLDRLRSHAMEATLQGASLQYVLTLVVKGIEQQNPGAFCSILLLDESRQRLVCCAAPSLPQAYLTAIEGIEIGEGVGSCGTAAFRRKRVIVDDIQTHPFWADFKDVAQTYNLRSCWSEPIFGRKHRLLGTFAIYHHSVSKPTQADLELTESMAAFVSLLIEEFQTEATLMNMANTDELTGLNNRRKLLELLEAEFQRAKRYGRSFSVCMLDLDFFKKVNDRYGHDAGDQVLKAVAQTINGVLRKSDVCGRIGGEEFAILLPDTALDSAAVFAERLRQNISELSVPIADDLCVTLTCSIGVAEFDERLDKASELLSCADQRLYYAKAHGRNLISSGATL